MTAPERVPVSELAELAIAQFAMLQQRQMADLAMKAAKADNKLASDGWKLDMEHREWVRSIDE